jgi:hypothetical protein
MISGQLLIGVILPFDDPKHFDHISGTGETKYESSNIPEQNKMYMRCLAG